MNKIDMTFEILFEDESVKMLELYKMSNDELKSLNTTVFNSRTIVPNEDTEKVLNVLKDEIENIKINVECDKCKLVALYKFVDIKESQKTVVLKAVGKNK